MPDTGKALRGFLIFLYVVAVTAGAFTGGVWGSLGIGGGLILYFGTALADRKLPMPPAQLGLFVVLTLGLLAAELPFSSYPQRSVKTWLHLTTIYVPLLLLMTPRVRALAYSPRFLPAVAMAMAIGAMGLGFEHLTQGAFIFGFKKPTASLNEYNRSMAHLVILGFAVAAGLRARYGKGHAVGLALLLLFPVSQTYSHTVKLAAAAGIAVTVFAMFYPALAQKCLRLGILAAVGWPLFAQSFFTFHAGIVAMLKDSFRHRMEVWDYLSYRILERPLLGWGLGTTNTLDFTTPHGELYQYAVTAAPHAHNFIVQTWVETGAPGLVLCLLFLMLLVQKANAMPASLRPFAFGGIAMSVVVCLFGFDFWSDSLWSAFALSAFVFGVLQQNGERKKNLVNAEVA